MFVDTGLGFWFVVLCCLSRSGRQSFSCADVVLFALALENFRSGMVSDGFQTQRRGFVDPWLRTWRTKILASAISIDGRREWACKKKNLESFVWTRWRCRRCHHDIPAVLHGKYRRAEEDRRNKCLEEENKEASSQASGLDKKEGEGVQGGQGLSIKE